MKREWQEARYEPLEKFISETISKILEGFPRPDQKAIRIFYLNLTSKTCS